MGTNRDVFKDLEILLTLVANLLNKKVGFFFTKYSRKQHFEGHER
jgi:hypothetical protein